MSNSSIKYSVGVTVGFLVLFSILIFVTILIINYQGYAMEILYPFFEVENTANKMSVSALYYTSTAIVVGSLFVGFAQLLDKLTAKIK
jgi:hypothetical protein